MEKGQVEGRCYDEGKKDEKEVVGIQVETEFE